MRPYTKHIAIRYHNFRSFVANYDVETKHVDIKEHIPVTFTKPLDLYFLDIYAKSLMVDKKMVSLFAMEYEITCMERVY